jgi:outer membrane protein OmpA-like peptidoglycan-associated protein
VEGHTDDAGNADANMQLSQRRAEAVVQWLTGHGVEAARLEAHGFGSTQPLQQGRTPAARAANRRVQFRIVSTPAPFLDPSRPSSSSAAP